MAEEEKRTDIGEERKTWGLLRLLREKRIRNFLREGEIVIPEKPGPKILGREPLIGSVRRSMGLPVLRDEVPTLIEFEE